jgi:hypothetical protein
MLDSNQRSLASKASENDQAFPIPVIVRAEGFEPSDDNAFVPSLVSKTSQFNQTPANPVT